MKLCVCLPVEFILLCVFLQRVATRAPRFQSSEAEADIPNAVNNIRSSDEEEKRDYSRSTSSEEELPKNYSGWRIIRLVLPPSRDPEIFSSIVDTSSSTMQMLNAFRTKEKTVIDLALSPTEDLEEFLSRAGFPDLKTLDHHDRDFKGKKNGNRRRRNLDNLFGWKTIIQDLGSMILQTQSQQDARQGSTGGMWNSYQRYSTINTFMEDLVIAHPVNVHRLKIGVTSQNRDISALFFDKKAKRLAKEFLKNAQKDQELQLVNDIPKNESKVVIRSTNKKKKKKKKSSPVIFLTFGAHAREWISPAVGTYIAQQLADAGKSLLKYVSVIIVPLTNPDGYEYSHTNDRLWRKNRQPTVTPNCVGVDLNRNYAYQWGTGGSGSSSDNPCSIIYRGTAPFSEPESAAIRDIALAYKKSLKLFLDVHSYGQMILHPWGYTLDPPPTKKKLFKMARKLEEFLNEAGDYEYEAGQSSHILYKASGTADDYVYSIKKSLLSYTIELPTNTFQLSSNLILPVAKQFWAGFLCIIGEVVGTAEAKEFCGKKLVKVQDANNVTLSGWFNSTTPIEVAKLTLLGDSSTRKRRPHKNGLKHRSKAQIKKKSDAKKRKNSTKNRNSILGFPKRKKHPE